MAGFNIVKIEDLPLGALVDATVFAVSNSGVTQKVNAGELSAFVGSMPKNNLTAITNPAITDDRDLGYVAGSIWYNSNTDTIFICEDATTGAAIWSSAVTIVGSTGKPTSRVLTAGETIAVGETCYLNSDGKVYKTSATTAATSAGLIGMAKENLTIGVPGEFVMDGDVTGYTGLTPGAIYYLGTTGGEITTELPAVSGEIVRVIGYALDATTMLFDPSKTWIELA